MASLATNDGQWGDEQDGVDKIWVVATNDGRLAQTMRVASSGPFGTFFYITFTFLKFTNYILP